MSKEIYISSTPHETRLAIVEKDELTEIYYERENEYTLAGSIYNGRVTRVLPGMQSSFVDIGLERDAFLYITDFMEEAADAADFESAAGEPRSDSRPQRNAERRDRGDRGGRGRRDGRGRGDRPREAQPEISSTDAVTDEPYRTADDPEALDAAPLDAAALQSDAEPIGEGAPGADGSRRWRGRRGRRRGRGLSAAGDAENSDATADGSPIIEESAAPDVDLPVAPVVRQPEPRSDRPNERGGDRGGERSGGRDRGDRRRGRDRGGRGDRDNRDNRQSGGRDRSAPRDPHSGVGREAAIDLNAAAGPAIEPLILPGESLSKYRRGEEATSTEQVTKPAISNLVVAKPSTEVEPLVGWDGGATLPGETLSRHRERGNSAPQDSGQRQRDRGNDRRRDRDDRHGRGGRDQRNSQSNPQPNSQTSYAASPRTLDPAEAVQPAVTSQHEPEANILPLHEDGSAVTHAALPDPVEFHETSAEYEPGEDASASYRVDPAGPSEFRQSATLDELEEPAAAEHTFTAIQPTGEMISEAPEAEMPAKHPAAPMEHEAAVQSVHLHEAQLSAVPFEAPGTFAPGDGQLEEELLEDEDGEMDVIHARASEDEMDVETLEHAADLGTMIRDMSIDQLTRPEPVELDEEEDDFGDEEDFEEDELEATGEEEGDEISASDVSEAEEGEFAEAAGVDEAGNAVASSAERAPRPGGREGGRRGRRDGRRGHRGGDRGSDRSPERSADRSPDRAPERTGDQASRERRGPAGPRPHDRRGGRHSVQASDLPAISDLLKPGQEVLVQIAKEPIAKKGARITSHIALPGRFLVFMPTVGHVGVSRKIESDAERRRLKEILLSERGEASGGFIVRTAAAGASEEDLRSDLRFLLNLWTDIKARSESSKSPALIYHDLNLVERILRDQVTDNFSAIWVDTEAEYERVLRFLQRFQPALVRRVKLYGKETPLFEQFGISAEIDKALRSKVWLKSGGSIVINQTEALVAIDINTGKFVGKTTKLEDTIVKTNLDAIPEIVRQIRLRDLGGIIIIDFIDMDERKNRNRVMAALEEELKSDRAPSKVLQFNDFGLVAITRKRVKQSLERTLSTTCGVCQGTGMTKAPVTVCNEIYIELRKMHKHIEKGDIMLRVHPEVVKQLKSNGGKWLQDMEELSKKTILVKSDPSLHPEQYDIH
jgi:ribonuclease G